MHFIEYIGQTGRRSQTEGHLGRHLKYFKRLNDATLQQESTKKKTLKSINRSDLFSTGLFLIFDYNQVLEKL